MTKPDPHPFRKRALIIGLGVLFLLAVLISALPLANAYLASPGGTRVYVPMAQREPTLTPTITPTPSPTPYYYSDGFDDPNSGWPIIYNDNPQDWYHFYYQDGDYRMDVFDDRTTHTAGPRVALPEGDYAIEFDSRFRYNGGWAHAYGIYFDGNDAPDNFKDYFAFRFLWEGTDNHSWSVIQFEDGVDVRKTPWTVLEPEYYHYGAEGTEWNHWKVIRTASAIQLFCNGHFLGQVNYLRPVGDEFFGVYGSTWELDDFYVAWDDYTVYPVAGPVSAWDESWRIPLEAIPAGGSGRP